MNHHILHLKYFVTFDYAMRTFGRNDEGNYDFRSWVSEVKMFDNEIDANNFCEEATKSPQYFRNIKMYFGNIEEIELNTK